MNLIALLGIVSVLALGVVLVLRRLISPAAITACAPDWLDEFSIEKYRPMLRLLDQEDYNFLALQAGQTASTLRKLRRERRRIFRAYLRSLTADFHRLHLAGKLILVYSQEDRSDLAAKLVQQRITFSVAVVKVHMNLVLHTLGIGTVDVRNLLGTVENLRLEVASASPGLA